MKKKYEIKNGQRVHFCTYKNCRQYANPRWEGITACDRHAQELYRLSPVSMQPTWFSRLVQEVAEFIGWPFGR